MELTNEQLERLIVRSLDGELSDDEQLALDRELIRNPEARALMDEYREVDSVCTTAMSAWLDAGEKVQSSKFEVQCGERKDPLCAKQQGNEATRQEGVGWAVPTIPSRDREGADDIRSTRRTHHYRQLLILIPGAIAAALLAIVFPWPAKNPNGDVHSNHPLQSGIVDESLRNQLPSVFPHSMNGTPMRNAAWTNPATFRGTGREVIGIMGDDGNIYWIEVERTRTIERGANPLPADKLDQM